MRLALMVVLALFLAGCESTARFGFDTFQMKAGGNRCGPVPAPDTRTPTEQKGASIVKGDPVLPLACVG